MSPGESSNQRAAGSTQRFGVLIDQWEEAWRAGAAPDLSAFLSHAPTEGRPALLLELLPIDLEQRWRRADIQETLPRANDDSLTPSAALPPRPRLEDYAAHFPQLQPLADLPPHLIAWEFYVRHRYGDRPPREEYLARFPAQSAALQRELEQIEAALAHEARPSPPNDAPPTSSTALGRLGPYELLAEIGRGGMGLVYQARHRLMDRLVALKIPAPELIRSADGRERFLREARSAARLKHPHICTVHDVVEEGGQPYIVMDFVRGVTLREWAQKSQPNARQIAETLAALARAVGYAHEHGVLHRDLKPGNAMIDAERGQPVLMDFGLAKELSDLTSDLTHTGQVMGTPAYMAPEQAAGRMDQVGPAADIYSLGAILYELLCGQPPFVGPVGEVLRRVQTEEPLAPRKVAPRVHVDLETVCLKALAKDPAQRYATAVALAEDLERFASGEGILARRASVGMRLWRKVRRSPAVAAAIVVTVLAIATASVLALHSASTRKLARVQGRVENALDALDGTPERLTEVETLLAELAALNPQQAEDDRERALTAHAAALQRRVQQTAALSPADFEELTAAITDLSARDAAAAERLQTALDQRRHGYELFFEATAETPAEELFDSSEIERTPEGWRTTHVMQTAETHPVFVQTPATGDLRIEALFAKDLGSATEVGFVLNATEAHAGSILSIRFSPDGRYFATASSDQTVKVWAAQTCACLGTLRPANQHGLTTAVFLADHTTLLTCAGEVQAWNVPERAPLPLPCEDPGLTYRVDASIDGRVVAFQSHDGQMRVWDVARGPELQVLRSDEPVRTTALSSDGRQIVLVGATTARLYDVASGSAVRTFEGSFPVDVSSVNFFGGDRMVVLACRANDGYGSTKCLVWDAATGALLPHENEDRMHGFVTASAGQSFLGIENIAGEALRGIDLWEWGAAQPRTRLMYPAQQDLLPCAMQLSPDGGQLVCGLYGGSLHRWDARTGAGYVRVADERYRLSLRSSAAQPADEASPAAAANPSPVNAQPADEASQPANEAPLPLEDANANCVLEISRGGELLDSLPVPGWRPKPEGVRLFVSREGGRLRLELDHSHAVEFDDLFGGAATAERWGLVWPLGVTLQELRAKRRESNAGASPLEQGDVLFVRREFADALDFYEQQARLSAGEGTNQQARYKAALCLLELQRTKDAIETLQQLSREDGARWPLLATCRLWLDRAAAEDWAGANEFLQVVTARFELDEVQEFVPLDWRRRLAQSSLAYRSAFNLYQVRPEAVAELEQCIQVAEWAGVSATSAQWRLMRCLRALGREEEARMQIERLFAEEDGLGPDQIGTLANELAWVYRAAGDPQAALDLLDKVVQSATEMRQIIYFLHRVQLDRARTLAVLGRLDEAEREVDAFLQSAPDGMPEFELNTAKLVLGMIQAERGDKAQALATWRTAQAETVRDFARGSAQILQDELLLGSLTGDLTDVEAERLFADMVASLSGNASVAGLTKLVPLSPSVLRGTFRSPRGRALARQIVLRECTFADTLQFPPVLIAYELWRQEALPATATMEEDDLVWALANAFFDRFQARALSKSQILFLGATWLGETSFLGWGGVGPTLPDDFRAPAAYVFGCRFAHHLQQPDKARAFYEEALAHAAEQPAVARLAEQALARLGPAAEE